LCFHATRVIGLDQVSKSMRGTLVRLGLVFLLLANIGAGVASAAEGDAEAARVAVNRFAEAWNRHDMDAFGALFARDADFVNVTGQLWKGREEIRRRHAYTHGVIPREAVPEALPANYGIFKSSTYQFDRIDVRLLASNLAVAHGAWTMQGDARTTEPRRGMMTFLLTRDGDNWFYEAVQNTEINRQVR
jgi:uncharacterized protein (TIGR02246 family)